MVKRQKAQNLAMYILLLGAVTLSLTVMQTYIKRGVQARVKDLSDAFIAPEEDHLTNWDMNYMTASSRNTQTSNETKQYILDGGGKRYETDMTISATSDIATEDPTKVVSADN